MAPMTILWKYELTHHCSPPKPSEQEGLVAVATESVRSGGVALYEDGDIRGGGIYNGL